MMNDLPKQWFTAGSNLGLWGSGGTYKAVPYEALPPLPARGDDDFAWLAAAPEIMGGIDYRDDYDPEEWMSLLDARLEPLLAEANALGLVVPEAFVRFMGDRNLTARVPSCTACYLDLQEHLIPLPEGKPGHLLHFLSDQQYCLLWFLRLLPGGGHEVVAAFPEFEGSDEDDDDNDNNDDNDNDDDEGGESRGVMLADLCTLRDFTLCAPSFLDFLQRFWLENTLWNAMNARQELTPDESAYVDAAQKAVLSMKEG